MLRCGHFILLLVLNTLILNAFSGISSYQEAFHSLQLPGSPGDPRGLPNLPFTTDTNRFSDGFTSTSFYEISSPRFTQYRGSLANVSDRYLHYTRYMESAAKQGIAGYEEGDARKEDAKFKIIEEMSKSRIPIPPPTKIFPVYAAIKWNPSDFAIQEGETYNISVAGSQTGNSTQFWYDGGLRVNADGYDSYFDAISNCYVALGRCRPHLKKKRRLLSANWMSLTCSIGEFVRVTREFQEGTEHLASWLPIDESRVQNTIFNVGQTIEFRALYSGQLICFANDAHTLYWNNQGSLDVTVTRISWPPTNTLIYQQQYLPNCDSALAVYANKGDTDPSTMKMKCNPTWGGGWDPAEVKNTDAHYGSGAPEYLGIK